MGNETCMIKIENLILSRGHIILWLAKKAESAETRQAITNAAFPRFVYISGELTMDGKFYADTDQECYWVEKPEDSVYFLDDLSVLGTVTDEDKLQIILAVNERNHADPKNVQIICEPILRGGGA